jgi:hypothetical protein
MSLQAFLSVSHVSFVLEPLTTTQELNLLSAFVEHMLDHHVPDATSRLHAWADMKRTCHRRDSPSPFALAQDVDRRIELALSVDHGIQLRMAIMRAILSIRMPEHSIFPHLVVHPTSLLLVATLCMEHGWMDVLLWFIKMTSRSDHELANVLFAVACVMKTEHEALLASFIPRAIAECDWERPPCLLLSTMLFMDVNEREDTLMFHPISAPYAMV